MESFLLSINWFPTHLGLSIVGFLLSIYWGATMVHDPANQHVPAVWVHGRRAGVVLAAFGMMMSVLIAHDQKWEPWWSDTVILIGIDMYFLSSIISAIKRMKVCSRCPYAPGTTRPANAMLPQHRLAR